jgi:hypothetical protein
LDEGAGIAAGAEEGGWEEVAEAGAEEGGDLQRAVGGMVVVVVVVGELASVMVRSMGR